MKNEAARFALAKDAPRLADFEAVASADSFVRCLVVRIRCCCDCCCCCSQAKPTQLPSSWMMILPMVPVQFLPFLSLLLVSRCHFWTIFSSLRGCFPKATTAALAVLAAGVVALVLALVAAVSPPFVARPKRRDSTRELAR